MSTLDPNPALKSDALTATGFERVFVEKASGASRERLVLKAALDAVRGGDTLVVWKLDRRARSLKRLIEAVGLIEERGIGLRAIGRLPDRR